MAAAAALPEGYRHGLEDRVALARARVAALRRLRAAVEQSASEAAIAPPGSDWPPWDVEGLVEPAWMGRIELAQKRLPLRRGLARALPTCRRPTRPPAAGDSGTRTCWQTVPRRKRGGPTYREAAWPPRAAPAHGRGGRPARRCRDRPADRGAGLAGYPFPSAWRPAIQAARSRSARAETLLAALEQNDREAFVEALRRPAGPPVPRTVCAARGPAVPVDRVGRAPAGDHRAGAGGGPGEPGVRGQGDGGLSRAVDLAAGAVQRGVYPWRFVAGCRGRGAIPGTGRPCTGCGSRTRGWERGGGSRLVYAEPAWRGADCRGVGHGGPRVSRVGEPSPGAGASGARAPRATRGGGSFGILFHRAVARHRRRRFIPRRCWQGRKTRETADERYSSDLLHPLHATAAPPWSGVKGSLPSGSSATAPGRPRWKGTSCGTTISRSSLISTIFSPATPPTTRSSQLERCHGPAADVLRPLGRRSASGRASVAIDPRTVRGGRARISPTCCSKRKKRRPSPAGPPWTGCELWGAPGWVHEDSAETPHLLPALASPVGPPRRECAGDRRPACC